jgi:hypothetical protein
MHPLGNIQPGPLRGGPTSGFEGHIEEGLAPSSETAPKTETASLTAPWASDEVRSPAEFRCPDREQPSKASEVRARRVDTSAVALAGASALSRQDTPRLCVRATMPCLRTATVRSPSSTVRAIPVVWPQSERRIYGSGLQHPPPGASPSWRRGCMVEPVQYRSDTACAQTLAAHAWRCPCRERLRQATGPKGRRIQQKTK